MNPTPKFFTGLRNGLLIPAARGFWEAIRYGYHG